MLNLQGLCLQFDRRPVLHNVSLEARPGQLWAFLGPNGSGKTSLLKTILGFLAPSGGRVLLDGKPLQAYAPRARAQRMAWVPQHLPETSALCGLELVSMGQMPFCNPWRGPGPKEQQRALHMLQTLGLGALASRPLCQLSGGERRMLWLARAFLQAPRLLCLDEPTAFLDMPKQSFALQLLRERCLKEGLLALVVLHELNLASAYATHTLLLKEGRVLGAGPAASHLNAATLSTLFDFPLLQAQGPQGQTLFAPAAPPGHG